MSTALARQALSALDAEEPDLAPAQLTDGGGPDEQVLTAAWEDPWVQVLVRQDPANAATYRPHVIAACQALDRAGYRAPGVRCGCGYGLGFLALAPLPSGVSVLWERRRLPPKARRGGWRDLAGGASPGVREGGWNDLDDDMGSTLTEYGVLDWVVGKTGPMYQGSPFCPAVPEFQPYPAVAPGVAILDNPVAARQAYCCPRCGARHVRLNVHLVRAVLRAVADGTGEVVLGGAVGTHPAVPRYAKRIPDRGPAWVWAAQPRRRIAYGPSATTSERRGTMRARR